MYAEIAVRFRPWGRDFGFSSQTLGFRILVTRHSSVADGSQKFTRAWGLDDSICGL